ncbi:RNA polymerase sigma factor [Thalassotalea sediminis]|uniref:RNA polymerase sigma factor n=1 Tax=Thalassotalea sediminis TaxID=1759089 RepID=UPI002572C48F|nr:RNA polymerase sigma factor [Thalassotalea sediminis]
MPLQDESSLIAQVIIHGDNLAFGKLVAFYQQPLRQYCRRLTAPDHALADDIAQECFVQAFRNIAQFSGKGKFQSWLFRIAYYSFLQHLRRKQVTEEYIEQVDESADTANQTIQWDLERAMAALSTEERTCLTLVFSFGYTQQECAEILEKPLGTIKSHCKRGKEKLTQLMTNDGNINNQPEVA